MKKLVAPRGLEINFAPSEKQALVWNALQPDRCDKCGGHLKMLPSFKDEKGNVIHEATCVDCGNTDIPELILAGGSAGGGKALSIDSNVLTPWGFRPLRELRVGMKISNPANGSWQRITQIHPKGVFPFYRVHFSDGTHTDCSEGHLWKIHVRGNLHVAITRWHNGDLWTAKEIFEWYKNGKNKEHGLAVPLTRPVRFYRKHVKKIMLPPYSVGMYLGDQPIPDFYKAAGFYERLDFLRGLLRVTHGDKLVRSSAIFKCANARQAEDVAYMVRSIGGLAKIDGNNVDATRIHYTKGRRDDDWGFKDIDSIEPIGEQESFCISVSSPGGLYITDNFTVTHNSYLGCAWVVSSCIRFAGIRMVLARLENKNLLATTWATMRNLLAQWGLVEEEHYHINNQYTTLTFWNGSTISGLALTPTPRDPDFNSLGSLEITGGFVDEVSEISSKAIEVLQSRIRYKIADTFVVGKLLMSTNPCLTWVRSTFVQDDDGLPVKLPKGYRYIPFSLFDNPDEQFRITYFNKLRKIRDQTTRNRLLYGNWDFVSANPMSAYWHFDGNRHICVDVHGKYYDPLKPLILSFDFNVNPYMSCLPIQINYDKREIYVFPEYTGKAEDKLNNTPAFSRFIADELVNMRHVGGVVVTGDPSGAARSTQTEAGVNNFTIMNNTFNGKHLNSHIDIFTTQPAHVTRLEFVNALLDGYEGWRVLIDLKCRKLTADFSYQKKNSDGTKEKKKGLMPDGTRAEMYGHLSDCFDYAVTRFLRDVFKHYTKADDVKFVTTIDSYDNVYEAFSY